MRHLARLAMPMDVWITTMRVGVVEVVHWPVPEGAVLLQVHYDAERHVWWAIFAHASFPAVPEGAVIPELAPAVLRTVGEPRR